MWRQLTLGQRHGPAGMAYFTYHIQWSWYLWWEWREIFLCQLYMPAALKGLKWSVTTRPAGWQPSLWEPINKNVAPYRSFFLGKILPSDVSMCLCVYYLPQELVEWNLSISIVPLLVLSNNWKICKHNIYINLPIQPFVNPTTIYFPFSCVSFNQRDNYKYYKYLNTSTNSSSQY